MEQTGRAVIGLVAVTGGVLGAGVSWAALGYTLAWKLHLSLGMILPPLVAGCVAGLIFRFGAKGIFNQHAGWIAVVTTFVGCTLGDLVWIKLASGKTLSVLLGPELIATLNTLFDFMKALMYAAACYLAYAITVPPKPYVGE